MQRLIWTISLFLILGPALRAQNDFQRLNEDSYRHYLAAHWDSVLITSKEALRLDIDFYYLRMRMGIASYELKHYRKAARHFEKALEFNGQDPLSLEYLYYSYEFSGQADRARLLRQEFGGDLALKLAPEGGKIMEGIAAEGLYSWGASEDLISDPDLTFPLETPGVQYLTRHYTNLSLALTHRIGARTRIRHSYTYLDKTNLMYYFDGLVSIQIPDQHVFQHQYYLAPSFTTLSGWTLSPSFHLVNVHYQVIASITSEAGQGNGFGGGSGGGSVNLDYQQETDLAGGLEVVKSLGNFDLEMGVWYAGLNKEEQAQGRLGATWYPLGNLNLYGGLFLNGQLQWSDVGDALNLIPELHLGGSIAGKLWLDLNGSLGRMHNYLEQNSAVVFNSFSETIMRKLMMTLSLPLGPKGSTAYLGARWSGQQSEFFAFDQGTESDNNPVSYNAYSIFGGLSWTF